MLSSDLLQAGGGTFWKLKESGKEFPQGIMDTTRASFHPTDGNSPSLPVSTRVIAVWNRKGGVAKTTLAVNLADHFARLNRNVLLIDADPQGSATNDLGFNANELKTTFWSSFLQSPVQTPSIFTAYENFDVGLCGGVIDREWDRPEWNRALAEQEVLDFFHRLRRGEVYGGEYYHYVFFDCAGSGVRDKLNRWALLAADEVLIPVAINVKGLLTQPGPEIADINNLRLSYGLPPLMVTGIIPVVLGRVNQSVAQLIESNVMHEIARLMGTQLFPAWLEASIVRQAESRRCPIGRLNLGRSISRQHQLRTLEHLERLAECLTVGAPTWVRELHAGDSSLHPERRSGTASLSPLSSPGRTSSPSHPVLSELPFE